MRNQPSNRVHDIEFAAEISTSLIAQVRNLQTLLSERDSDFKEAQSDKARLEIEAESLQQRLKALDESEHRYKEENWNLETRLQEISAQQREAADREKKLSQALNLSSAEKAATQKELDDTKLSHSRLLEEHAAAVKQLDIELGTTRRNMVTAESERAAMQQKIDDLTGQNQELAKAFSAQRLKPTERESGSGLSDEDFETAADNATPEHSPPASPVKGTPRHSMLETETIKSSLHHAQRTIQSQRSQLHREKTEKLELRRIIQDLRDDLEKTRTDPSAASTSRRNRKVESKEFKKPAHLLGSLRSSRSEILMDDPDWEDNAGASPTQRSFAGGPTPARKGSAGRLRQANGSALPTDGSDQFDTANEASESAFETANERATETEDFQTGNEDMSGSDDSTATETEGVPKGLGRGKRPPSLSTGLSRASHRASFTSTASTSADEDAVPELRTPTATLSSQRSRFRLRRDRDAQLRGARQSSEEPTVQSSPASYTSRDTPQDGGGQSLFAELQDMGSDDETLSTATPSRRSVRSATPASARHTPYAASGVPKVTMVDSGVMTDPVNVTMAQVFQRRLERPTSLESVVYTGERPSLTPRGAKILPFGSRRASTLSNSDVSAHGEEDMDVLAEFPAPPSSPPTIRPPPTPPSLGLSRIQTETVEPRMEIIAPPTPPTLGLTPLAVEHVEPVPEARMPSPELSLSHMASEVVVPVLQPEPTPPLLAMTAISSEAVEPLTLAPPVLTMSGLSSQVLEPIAEPVAETQRAVPPVAIPAALTMSSIHSEHLEPREQPERLPVPPALRLSDIAAEQISPVSEAPPLPPALALSTISTQQTQPAVEVPPAPPALVLSAISAEHVEPIPSVFRLPTPPSCGLSAIASIETCPVSPRSPRRDAFILPRDNVGTPDTFADTVFGSRGQKEDIEPFIAEDDTRQSRSNSPDAGTPESQRPFKELSTNTNLRSARRQSVPTIDHGAQTSLTAGAIDQLIKSGSSRTFGHVKGASVSSIGTSDTADTVRIYRPEENLGAPARSRGRATSDLTYDSSAPVRPGSAASMRDSARDAPPLPSNHRQVIESARLGSSHSQGQGSMGPPLWPASATKHRSQMPSQQQDRNLSQARTGRDGSVSHGTVEIQSSGRPSAPSRRSSVSSFASEIDSRFNMAPGDVVMGPDGFGLNTDPRMIQAITQTMIGEFLWKYTRKTGRGELSENRHRRYFWVHPYTRTLYWSNTDPSTAGRSELKAKSVPIESVRVVTDDNPMPPGLHRKSIIIISPGRTIKFTCTTGQRHETWFNALSYLLLRTGEEHRADTEDLVGHITQEDVDEFNPQTRRPPPGNAPNAKTPASLSSYNSRTTRNDSPAFNMSMDIPTLTPSGHHKQGIATSRTPAAGTFSKLSGYWRSGAPRLSGTLTGLRGRGASSKWDVYEASAVHDSAEDLREMIERQDREADRLENVRACCDGRHDVGSLPRTARRGRSYGSGSHAHPGPSVPNTPMTSLRSRA